MKRQRFRVGQRVQSVFDPTHVFVIDESRVPERIFHEKGSNRWWTKNELQRLGTPEDPATSVRLNGKEKMRGTRSNAFSAVSGGLRIVAEVTTGPEQRECLLRECAVTFQPKRPWQKFHSEACRLAHWKRSGRGARSRGCTSPSAEEFAPTRCGLLAAR
jgi:hypothetical protein